MTLQEKNLYQQIHPVRLATDWSTGIAAVYLFWIHELWIGVILSFIPSLIVSLFIIRFGNLEKLKNSRFGVYFKRTYNKTVDLIRFGGFVVFSASSWFHFIAGIALGLLIIILTWIYGLLIKK